MHCPRCLVTLVEVDHVAIEPRDRYREAWLDREELQKLIARDTQGNTRGRDDERSGDDDDDVRRGGRRRSSSWEVFD